jgi:hypothetical protein
MAFHQQDVAGADLLPEPLDVVGVVLLVESDRLVEEAGHAIREPVANAPAPAALYTARAFPETARMAHPVREATSPSAQRHGSGTSGLALRSLLWLTLGGWVGSWACFGLLVAPMAFQILPSTRIAGTLVGPILTALHLYGGVAGAILALLAWLLGRGRLRIGLPLAMAIACLYSHFGVSAEIAELSGQAFGPEGSEALAARFNTLHQLSLWIFGVVSAVSIALVVLHARSDTP